MPSSHSRRLVVSSAVILLLIAVWLGRSHLPPVSSFASMAVKAVPEAPPTRLREVIAASVPSGVAESERAGEAKLLADVAALSAEFDRLRALPDDIERFRRSADLENEFAAMLDADTAAFLVRCMPAGFVDSHFGVISLHLWAGANRPAAAAWMALHPGATPASAEALARGWFAEAPSTLAAHLDQLPSGPWKTRLAITAGEDAFLAHDSAAVLGLLDRAAADDVRRLRLIEWTATAWARSDVDAAAAWAAREPQPARRETLLAAVAIGQANTDPAAASVRLLQTVTDPEIRKPAVQALVRIWAARDPEAAASWVGGLPEDSPHKKEAEETLLALAAR